MITISSERRAGDSHGDPAARPGASRDGNNNKYLADEAQLLSLHDVSVDGGQARVDARVQAPAHGGGGGGGGGGGARGLQRAAVVAPVFLQRPRQLQRGAAGGHLEAVLQLGLLEYRSVVLVPVEIRRYRQKPA